LLYSKNINKSIKKTSMYQQRYRDLRQVHIQFAKVDII
jgi:hypothetical protein